MRPQATDRGTGQVKSKQQIVGESKGGRERGGREKEKKKLVHFYQAAKRNNKNRK